MKFAVPIVALLALWIGWSRGGAFVSQQTESASARKETLSALTLGENVVPVAIERIEKGGRRPSFAELSAFVRQLDTAGASDCRRWLAMLPEGELWLITMVMMRLAEIDPHSALEAMRLDEKLQRYEWSVFASWASRDLEAATESAQERRSASAVWGLMDGAGTASIERLYDLLVAAGYDKRDPSGFDRIFPKIAEVDPARAAGLAMRSWSDGHRGSITAVLKRWVGEDPEAAFAWAGSLEKLSVRQAAQGTILQAWLERDPAAALEMMGDDFAVLHSLNGVLLPTGSLSDSGFECLLDWYEKQPLSTDGDRFLSYLAQGLSRGDHPQRLAVLVDRLFTEQFVVSMSGQVVDAAENWALRDERGLAEFIASIGEGPLRDLAIRGMVDHLAEVDPLRALEYINSLGKPNILPDLSPVFDRLLKQGLSLDEAMQRIPAGMRDKIFDGRRFDCSERPPGEVVAFLERQPPGDGRDRAMSFAGGLWARQDPQAAAAWVVALGDDGIRAYAAGNVANAWAMVDLDAAVEWAGALDDPQSRSRALAQASKVAAGSQPERAVEVAAGIADPALRNEALSGGLRSLARRDPDRAVELMRELGVDDSVRNRVEEAAGEARLLRPILRL